MIALALAAAMILPNCPLDGETAQDCPWAAIGRAAAVAPDAPAALKVLRAEAPALVKQFEADARRPELLSLWGTSVNFDEHAQAVIVAPQILAALGGPAGHAGLTHTYGYLFSVLKTPYGFKRARWVSGDSERGLGLPAGIFSPAPSSGTLLSNLTAFAGSIAFRTDARELRLARKLRKFDVSAFTIRRLVETISMPGGPLISIRTDLVSNTVGTGALLVYSWRDEKAKRAYLITAFPVADSFAESLFAAKGLGEDQPIAPRYNALIEPLSGLTGLRGSRRAAP